MFLFLISENFPKLYWVSSCWLHLALCVLAVSVWYFFYSKTFSWEFWGEKVDILHVDFFYRKIRQESRNVNRQAQENVSCVSRSQSVLGDGAPSETQWRLILFLTLLDHCTMKWWLQRVFPTGSSGLLQQTVLACGCRHDMRPCWRESAEISQRQVLIFLWALVKANQEGRWGERVHGWGQGSWGKEKECKRYLGVVGPIHKNAVMYRGIGGICMILKWAQVAICLFYIKTSNSTQ